MPQKGTGASPAISITLTPRNAILSALKLKARYSILISETVFVGYPTFVFGN